MSLPQGGCESREKTGRRKLLIWCAVLVVFVAGWALLVLGWGGSAKEAANGASELEVAQIRDAGDGSDAGGATGKEQDSETSSVPEESAYAEDEGVSEGQDNTAPDGDGGMLEGSGGGLTGESLGRQDETGAQGATNEPGVYDPLGTGASSTDLAPTNEARVRYAAEKFVMAAYGYTGSDAAEYLAGVAETSLSPDLSLSAGGKEISRYAEQVEKSGTKSAAVLTDFEFTETSKESVTGVANFEIGEGYGPDGDLEGEILAYAQEMTLSDMGAMWKVKVTQEIEKVERTTIEGEG